MNATNVITVDFRPKRPATQAAVPARPLCACTLVYRLVASVTFAFSCWLVHVAYLLTLWL
jgi:hypothetical protein